MNRARPNGTQAHSSTFRTVRDDVLAPAADRTGIDWSRNSRRHLTNGRPPARSPASLVPIRRRRRRSSAGTVQTHCTRQPAGLERLAEQTAALHRQFLEGQEKTQQIFLKLLDQEQRLSLAVLDSAESPTRAPEPVPRAHQYESARSSSTRIAASGRPAALRRAGESHVTARAAAPPRRCASPASSGRSGACQSPASHRDRRIGGRHPDRRRRRKDRIPRRECSISTCSSTPISGSTRSSGSKSSRHCKTGYPGCPRSSPSNSARSAA